MGSGVGTGPAGSPIITWTRCWWGAQCSDHWGISLATSGGSLFPSMESMVSLMNLLSTGQGRGAWVLNGALRGCLGSQGRAWASGSWNFLFHVVVLGK